MGPTISHITIGSMPKVIWVQMTQYYVDIITNIIMFIIIIKIVFATSNFDLNH